MRVHVVDPSAYTPPYDDALCAALARAGARVELFTSRFAYGDVPAPRGYRLTELFYARALGAPGSRLRRFTKLLTHVPDMLRYRRLAGTHVDVDVVHFQWLALQWLDAYLLPDRPLVLTAHDLLPREPRPGQARAQRRLYDRVDALVVHSEYGRRRLVDGLGVAASKVHVIHHGAFAPVMLPDAGAPAPPPELDDPAGPVVLCFGLLRPYKGIDTLLRAWAGVTGAQLWIVGRPMMALAPLRSLATSSVRFVARFVSDAEVSALLARADVVVLPYTRTERLDQSGVLAAALGFGKPIVVTDVGGFSEIAATGAVRLVAPDDPDRLRGALQELIADPGERRRLAARALAAAQGPYSWDESARATLALYERLMR